MIPIKGVDTAGDSYLEMDFYVILHYVLKHTHRGDRIVGYLGDHRRNSAEIKIDRLSGEIYSFVVLGTDQEITCRADDPFALLPARQGIPVVDVSSFAFQEPREFGHPAHFDNLAKIHCTIVAEQSISVILDTTKEPTNLIDAGSVKFLLSDRMLVGLLTRPLSASELDLFDEWAERMQKPRNG
ncbi:hypothetical protein [Mycobacterium camsae]|uniref:hypothetical protein n=1 Tax=Mycobacterium gordonae TaxID=1778 RepID=UPI00197E91F7|nr:hypothetical protein [Mycobacterium gordonae]